MAKETKPEFTARVGGIQVAVWSNKTDKGVFKSVSITKTYKDGDKWKQSKSFKATDLEKIRLGIDEVLKYFYLKGEVITPTVDTEEVPF